MADAPRKEYNPFQPCWVYFVTAEGVADYPVKIGMTVGSVEQRMMALQTGCPYPLVLLAKVRTTADEERRLHQQLSAFRMSGEWFRRSPEVMRKAHGAKHRQAGIDDEPRRIEEAWNSLPQDVRDKVSAKRNGAYVE